VGAGFLVVWLPPNVRGFRPVLANGWHDQLGRSVWVRLAQRADTYALVSYVWRSVVDAAFIFLAAAVAISAALIVTTMRSSARPRPAPVR
jgi:hypothetical protein